MEGFFHVLGASRSIIVEKIARKRIGKLIN
jgi:hypothetical protein